MRTVGSVLIPVSVSFCSRPKTAALGRPWAAISPPRFIPALSVLTRPSVVPPESCSGACQYCWRALSWPLWTGSDPCTAEWKPCCRHSSTEHLCLHKLREPSKGACSYQAEWVPWTCCVVWGTASLAWWDPQTWGAFCKTYCQRASSSLGTETTVHQLHNSGAPGAISSRH